MNRGKKFNAHFPMAGDKNATFRFISIFYVSDDEQLH